MHIIPVIPLMNPRLTTSYCIIKVQGPPCGPPLCFQIARSGDNGLGAQQRNQVALDHRLATTSGRIRPQILTHLAAETVKVLTKCHYNVLP